MDSSGAFLWDSRWSLLDACRVPWSRVLRPRRGYQKTRPFTGISVQPARSSPLWLPDDGCSEVRGAGVSACRRPPVADAASRWSV